MNNTKVKSQVDNVSWSCFPVTKNLFLPFIYTAMDAACLNQEQLICDARHEESKRTMKITQDVTSETTEMSKGWSYADRNVAIANR